jgi:hypothetical protein
VGTFVHSCTFLSLHFFQDSDHDDGLVDHGTSEHVPRSTMEAFRCAIWAHIDDNFTRFTFSVNKLASIYGHQLVGRKGNADICPAKFSEL